MKYHGLHIGIDYANDRQSALSKCIQDAKRMRASFSPDCASSRSLLEAEATKNGIVQAILQLWTVGDPSDMAIITYSGHGTKMPARGGGEADGQDEAFVPYDFRRGNLLTDNELAVLLSRRPQGKPVLLITDCCHSGTIARSVLTDVRYLPFSEIIAGMAPDRVESLYSTTRANLPDGVTDGVAHIAGCQDDEFSYENSNGGVLTETLLAEKAKLAKGATISDWFARTVVHFPTRKYPQNPQFNAGAKEAAWFVPGFEPEELPPVVQPGGDQPRGSVRMIDADGVEWRAIGWERVK